MRTLLFVSLLFSATALADEGMWTFDNFPADSVAKRYGFKPDQPWLDKVRLGSARLAQGCSASFVSAQGLVMTNHHCAHSCIEQLSDSKHDYIKDGFYAKTANGEKRCPEMEVNQLESIVDVTARMDAATKGKESKAFAQAQKAEMAKIKQECATSEGVRCDVVSLYEGGRYALYQYRRFQDVRLVFAPEFSIAFFGGDPYNFTFPRYNLDVAFLRVYEGGKPLQAKNYFPFSPAGAKEGELVFVSGHPGRTSRESTIAELTLERDFTLPRRIALSSELRGIITEYQREGSEAKRISNELLFGIENGLKSMKGGHAALTEAKFFASKVQQEEELKAKVKADKKLDAQYGQAWDKIANAVTAMRGISDRYGMIEGGRAFDSDSFQFARRLVRYADEKEKPNEERLREYVDSSLPELKQRLFSEAPVYSEMEKLRLRFGLSKMREILGPDDPLVQRVLGKKSPDQLADELVKGTKLTKVSERKKLFEGGSAAIKASRDPMILLALAVEPEARSLRRTMDEEIVSEMNKGHEMIAKARFALYGTSIYPDATFTLRLSYGAVEGLTEGQKKIAPITVMGGTYDQHTGQDPFALPPSWLKNKERVRADVPMNFASTNDIIGGNSGSPVINQKAEIVGLIFDGNIWSLGGRFGFDPKLNRAVSVHSSAILESLDKIYQAKPLVDELRPSESANNG